MTIESIKQRDVHLHPRQSLHYYAPRTCRHSNYQVTVHTKTLHRLTDAGKQAGHDGNCANNSKLFKPATTAYELLSTKSILSSTPRGAPKAFDQLHVLSCQCIRHQIRRRCSYRHFVETFVVGLRSLERVSFVPTRSCNESNWGEARTTCNPSFESGCGSRRYSDEVSWM